MAEDFYSLLGVGKNASQDDIRAAYRRMARRYHPDVNPGDRQAEERFKQVGQAFEVLSDKQKRKLYDTYGPAGVAGAASAAAGGAGAQGFGGYSQARDMSDMFGSHFSDFFSGGRPGNRPGNHPGSRPGGYPGARPGSGAGFDFGSVFSDFFGGAKSSPHPQSQTGGSDIETTLQITLKDAVLGATKHIVFERPQGNNKGLRAQTVRLKVKVPAGIDHGQVIRLAGQGRADGGGKPGDMLLRIQLLAHPHLQRDGDDLSMEIPITVAEAVRGSKVEVPLLDGKTVAVNVPAGSQSGRRLRLRGKGVMRKNKQPGDLYLCLQVMIPDSADADAVQAAEQLDKAYTTDIRAHLKQM